MPPQQGERRFDLVRCLLDLSAHGDIPFLKKAAGTWGNPAVASTFLRLA
jgi:hypothetical protein